MTSTVDPGLVGKKIRDTYANLRERLNTYHQKPFAHLGPPASQGIHEFQPLFTPVNFKC